MFVVCATEDNRNYPQGKNIRLCENSYQTNRKRSAIDANL
ncbi:Uncharacterized protein PPKH_1725 [Pseudomonas putida]|nr:Uncharacterized protein PPKH_1725 [Pseudomonas putida]